jgi:hypothetical protein
VGKEQEYHSDQQKHQEKAPAGEAFGQRWKNAERRFGKSTTTKEDWLGQDQPMAQPDTVVEPIGRTTYVPREGEPFTVETSIDEPAKRHGYFEPKPSPFLEAMTSSVVFQAEAKVLRPVVEEVEEKKRRENEKARLRMERYRKKDPEAYKAYQREAYLKRKAKQQDTAAAQAEQATSSQEHNGKGNPS